MHGIKQSGIALSKRSVLYMVYLLTNLDLAAVQSLLVITATAAILALALVCPPRRSNLAMTKKK